MKKSRLFSILSFILLIVVSLIFTYYVFRSQLIPIRLLVLSAVLFIIVLCLLFLLIFRSNHRFLTVLGGILCLVLCLVLLASTLYLNRAVRAAQNITTTKTEVATIGVYMLRDTSDESTALTSDLSYGILDQQDRENTDKVIDKLEEELGTSLNVKSYENISKLFDALIGQDVDAVIVNSAFLHLLTETEGYENLPDQLREIHKTQIIAETTASDPAPTSRPSKKFFNLLPKEKEKKDCFVLYISGVDTREDELIEKSRSDVNVLAVVNPNTHQILLLTTPRDYYVTLKFPDFTSYIKDKLTHAGMYGVQVSMDTLGLLYDINVDYYFRVNFHGFVDIVDAMGGVTVDVEKEFWSDLEMHDYHYTAGPNLMDGEKALVFVRTRKNIGDQQRGHNHMSFIKGVIDKATSTDMLLRFDDILTSVEGSFETSMPYDVMSSLVRDQIESGAKWNIVSYAVTGTGDSAMTYSMDIPLFVFIPDMSTVDTAKGLIQQVLNGETIQAPEESSNP